VENYHICKAAYYADSVDNVDTTLQDSVNEMVENAKVGGGSKLMNACISDLEVKHTFGKGSDTPGLYGILSKTYLST